MVKNPVPDETTIRRQNADGGGGSLAVHRIDWKKPANVSDDELLAFVQGQYDDGKARRYEWEREASLLLAWVRGNQELIWNDTLQGLEAEELTSLPLDCRDPIILNKLRGFLLDAIGLVLGKPISWEVFPATRENDDVTSAKAQAKLLRHLWGACSPAGQIKLIEAFWTMFSTGIVWAKATWDPFGGSPAYFDADMMREEGEKEDEPTRKKWTDRLRTLVGKKRKIDPQDVELDEDGLALPNGDIALDFISGFDVTEPQYCHLVEEAPWCIISRFRSIEYMRERYGSAAKDLQADSEDTLRKHRGFDFLFNAVARTGEQSTSTTESSEVLVHELWRPRIHGTAPVGFLGIVAGNAVMKKGKNPYVHGQIPLTTFREHGEPEAFRPNPTMRDLIGLQRSRNKQRSFLHAHLRQAIDPRIMNEDQSGLPEDAFTLGPKIIRLKEGGIAKVRAFEYPNPPNYMGPLDEMNVRDMEDIGRVHRSTTGMTEGSGQSGKHAELMTQGDQRGRTATKILIQASAARLGQQMLALVWQYYTEERSIQITGERGAVEVMTFKGRTLIARPPIGPDAANIRAVLGDEMSTQDTIAKVEGLTKMGYLSSEREEDRRTVMRWINENVPTDTDEESEHRTNAAMENELLLGKAADKAKVRAAYGDNDSVHIREHESLTTTSRYREACKKDPQVAVAWLVHLHEHLFGRLLKQMYPEAMKDRVADYIKSLTPPRPPEGMPAVAPPPMMGPPTGMPMGPPPVMPGMGPPPPMPPIAPPGMMPMPPGPMGLPRMNGGPMPMPVSAGRMV